jgi:hypothetical protein
MQVRSAHSTDAVIGINLSRQYAYGEVSLTILVVTLSKTKAVLRLSTLLWQGSAVGCHAMLNGRAARENPYPGGRRSRAFTVATSALKVSAHSPKIFRLLTASDFDAPVRVTSKVAMPFRGIRIPKTSFARLFGTTRCRMIVCRGNFTVHSIAELDSTSNLAQLPTASHLQRSS